MTVAQLIQHLRQYPDDLRVVVDSYEDGFDDVEPERILTGRISLNTGTQWYYGRHGGPEEGAENVDALLIRRDHSMDSHVHTPDHETD